MKPPKLNVKNRMIQEVSELNDFPEKMTADDVFVLVREGFLQNFETFDDLSVARKFAEAFSLGLSSFNAQLYTQVDGAVSGEIVYLKGEHVVNRTGVYLVAWH